VALVEKILCSKGFNQHAKRFFGILTGSAQVGLVWVRRKTCQPCFYRWISSYNADNLGFRKISCSCGREVSMDEVRHKSNKNFLKHNSISN